MRVLRRESAWASRCTRRETARGASITVRRSTPRMAKIPIEPLMEGLILHVPEQQY